MMGMTNPETVHYGMWDGSSVTIAAYFLALILIASKRKQYPQVFMLLVPASALFLAIMYFPGIYDHLPRTSNTDQRQVFRRFRWIFLMLPTLTMGMSFIIIEMKRRQRKIAFLVLFCFLSASVFYTSNGDEEYGFWDRKPNQNHIYKISNVAIAMADSIKEECGEYLDADKKRTVSILVCDDDRGKWQYSMSFPVEELRMYYSPVEWERVTINASEYNDPSFNLSDRINEKYDFVLCPENHTIVKSFNKLGYEELWYSDGKCFMRYGESSKS